MIIYLNLLWMLINQNVAIVAMTVLTLLMLIDAWRSYAEFMAILRKAQHSRQAAPAPQVIEKPL